MTIETGLFNKRRKPKNSTKTFFYPPKKDDSMITIKLDNFNSNMEENIKKYNIFAVSNTFSSLICPLCHNEGTLEYHKTYERNITYTDKSGNIVDTVINIVVVKCKHCTKHNNKQKYHAVLPTFIYPYHIDTAQRIIVSLNKHFCQKQTVDKVCKNNKVSRRTFYNWVQKFKKYVLSASVVLSCNSIINILLAQIVDNLHSFNNKFYEYYMHPFFLFKLTCVSLCLTP